MAEMTEADLVRLAHLLEPHRARLYREKDAAHRERYPVELVVDIPAAWDERGDAPNQATKCLGMPLFYADVEEPRVRRLPSPTEMLEEQARLVEERLRQRSAALGRVAAENERLRAALLRVINRADVERDLGLVRAEDIHDAIGYELIQELHSPKVQWREPAPTTLVGVAEALQRSLDRTVISQREVPPAFRRPTADEAVKACTADSEVRKILGIDDE